MRALATLALIVFAAAPAWGQRVSLRTSAGTILVELDARRAPVTTANFLRYVDQRKLDGTSFYRGFVQGGSRRPYVFQLPPIAHEPTTRTGLRHVDGTISMARTAPGTARSNFFITVGANPSMDANPAKPGDNAGFAAFGRVVGGMDVVRRILAVPTIANAGRGAMRGQMMARPVAILTARRAR